MYKDTDGEVEAEHLSNLSADEVIELGSKIGALIGPGSGARRGMQEGAVAGADAAAADGVHMCRGRHEVT